MADSTNCVRQRQTNGTPPMAPPVSIDIHKSDSSDSAASSHIGSIKYGTNDANGKGVNHHSLSELQLRQALEESDDRKGLLASGLGWLQRKREERRRQQLQQQADLQLQKILDAQQTLQQQNLQSKQSLDDSVGGGVVGGVVGVGGSVDQSDRTINTQKSLTGEGASGQISFEQREQEQDDDFFVPEVRVKPEDTNGDTPARPHILNQNQMNQIASLVLPQTISFCRWNRLYDLGRDGDSFEGCLRIVNTTQRTLMVVRTTKGEVFGGFADAAWATKTLASAKFYGGASACLFKVAADDEEVENPIRPFKWSGKNRYIQLCDTSRKMLAFGGGGENGAFGLAVEEDFQRGSTGHCDTFDNEPLCEDGSFEIVDLEIWEFLSGSF
ncbi:MAG: hypothetical protein SGBAC_003280 [Bacillariaceae sp.]